MTIKEAIAHVANTLEEINLPVRLIKTIGVPISNSVDILKQCIGFMEQAEQVEQEAQEKAQADQEAREKEEAENGGN